MKRSIQVAFFFASLLSLRASTIDVTADSLLTLQPGSNLLFYITSNYASYAEVSILIGGLPIGGAVASIPGTSSGYTPGVLFAGTLESMDGAVSIPLYDSNAARLGLPAGDIILGSGSRSGGSYSGPISLLSAGVTVSSAEAAALFSSGEVIVSLRELSGAITLGYPASPLATDFSSSFASADGTLSIGGRTCQVVLQQAPEPGTIPLLLIGLLLIGIPRILYGTKHRAN